MLKKASPAGGMAPLRFGRSCGTMILTPTVRMKGRAKGGRAMRRIHIQLEGREAMGRLTQAADGAAALLYACALAAGGDASLKDAAETLHMTEEQVQKAASLLVLYGLGRDAATPPPRAEISVPPGELLKARREDAVFRGLVSHAEGAFGRVLRKSELETLHSVYTELNLPADVLMLLINYCKMRDNVSAREMEKQAYRWADAGLTTYEEAERYMRRQQYLHAEGARVLRMLGVYDRRPSESEAKYIARWSDWGVQDDLLRLAYDRTVLRCGRLEWRYMDKILESWHSQGFETVRQVETGDRRTPPPRSAPAGQESVVQAVTRAFEEKRKAREERLEERLRNLMKSDPRFAENEKGLRLCASKAARAALGDEPQREELERRKRELLQARQEILRQNGLPDDWLSDTPDCPKCADRGYIGSSMCECFERACREEQQRRAREGNPA